MKRIDMRNAISDNVLTSFFPEMSLEKKNLIADCILAECEKLGMAPPEIKEWIEISADNILGAGFKVSHNIHKWEDE